MTHTEPSHQRYRIFEKISEGGMGWFVQRRKTKQRRGMFGGVSVC